MLRNSKFSSASINLLLASAFLIVQIITPLLFTTDAFAVTEGDAAIEQSQEIQSDNSANTNEDLEDVSSQVANAAPAPQPEMATITATKYFDVDGDDIADRTANAGEWQFSLDGATPVATDANGQVIFEVGDTSSYTITEVMPDGYELVSTDGVNCVDGQLEGEMIASVVVSDNGNRNAECNFVNRMLPSQRTGSITVTKKAVPQDEQDFNFEVLQSDDPLTEFTLDDDGNVNNTYPSSRVVTDLLPGSYDIYEAPVEGWELVDVTCNNQPIGFKGNTVPVRVSAGQDIECVFTNEKDAEPTLEISKMNNQGAATEVGSTVTYTIEVTNPQDSTCVYGLPADESCGDEPNEEMPYDVADGLETAQLVAVDDEPEVEEYKPATVVDLPPEGFNYVPGSYTAQSNVRGDLKSQGITTEPTYASPGTWNLTNSASNSIVPGEVITLTYQAVIASSVTPGTYSDTAFALAYASDSSDVYGNVALLDDPFVSSSVTIEDQPAAEGYVLGTTTKLVNTGIPAYVQSLVGAMLVGAAIAVGFGDKLKKVFGKSLKAAPVLPVALALVIATTSPALAFDPWQFSAVDLPSSTSNSDLNIAYQVSTVDPSNQFVVTLEQNGVVIETQNVTSTYGDSGSIPVSFAGEGDYKLKLTAQTTSGTNAGESKVKQMTITYDANAPQQAVFNGKVRSGNTWTVSFTIPAGSDAKRVQIFASTKSSFTANEETLVGEVNAKPGQQQSFTYEAPDSAERYFAIRTVDEAGNASTLVGDSETVIANSSDTVASSPASDSQPNGEVLAGDAEELAEESTEDAESSDDSNAYIWIFVAVAGLGVAAGIYWQSRSTLEE